MDEKQAKRSGLISGNTDRSGGFPSPVTSRKRTVTGGWQRIRLPRTSAVLRVKLRRGTGGVELYLTGDANDYVGKESMAGGLRRYVLGWLSLPQP